VSAKNALQSKEKKFKGKNIIPFWPFGRGKKTVDVPAQARTFLDSLGLLDE
jgi:hypothetical protein